MSIRLVAWQRPLLLAHADNADDFVCPSMASPRPLVYARSGAALLGIGGGVRRITIDDAGVFG